MSGNNERELIKPLQRVERKVCLTCKHRYVAYHYYTDFEYRCKKHEEMGTDVQYIVVLLRNL